MLNHYPDHFPIPYIIPTPLAQLIRPPDTLRTRYTSDTPHVLPSQCPHSPQHTFPRTPHPPRCTTNISHHRYYPFTCPIQYYISIVFIRSFHLTLHMSPSLTTLPKRPPHNLCYFYLPTQPTHLLYCSSLNIPTPLPNPLEK